MLLRVEAYRGNGYPSVGPASGPGKLARSVILRTGEPFLAVLTPRVRQWEK